MSVREPVVYVFMPLSAPPSPPAPLTTKPKPSFEADKFILFLIALLVAFVIGVSNSTPPKSPSPANPPIHPAASNQMPPNPPFHPSH